MQIYLPIAEVSVAAESLLFLGVAVGFLSGVFGVGGGFLATPFLLFMGIPPAVAVGTQANQLIATSMTGVLGHWRRGHVDREMGMMLLAGGAGGTILGILLFRLLDYLGQIDVFIALAYVLLLGSIGAMMLMESVFSLLKRPQAKEAGWCFAKSPKPAISTLFPEIANHHFHSSAHGGWGCRRAFGIRAGDWRWVYPCPRDDLYFGHAKRFGARNIVVPDFVYLRLCLFFACRGQPDG
jgi:hypothetical protein